MIVAIKAIESILSMIIIISIGYALTYKGWFTEETTDTLVKLVVNISMPFMMVNTVVNNFTREKFLSSLRFLFIPFLSIIICYGLSMIVCKVFNIDKSKQGLFKSMFFNSNTIFMGLPINMALFGEKSVPYVLIYYIANTSCFWTVGIYEISKDGQDQRKKLFSKESIKKIFSPPLIGFIVGIILLMVNIKLPLFLKDTCKYLGSITMPISMIFIGITMYSINLKNIKFNKSVCGVLLGRFLISPAIIIVLTSIWHIPRLMRNVFFIQSAMPVMTNTAIIAKSFKGDCEYAAIMIGLTTAMSLVAIPLYMLIIG